MLSRLRIVAISLGAAALLGTSPAAAQSDEEPLARFEDPVCVGVAGLRTEMAEAVVDRIRANVETFGRRLAPAGDCSPNLVVAFLTDPAAFIDQVRDENGWVFAEMRPEERDAAVADDGPARALLRVRARSRDGMPIPWRENLEQLPQTEQWMSHSKIYSSIRNDIINAMVLFDRDEVRGLTLDQLADYATFRALTRTLPETPAARAASILSLFDSTGARPAELTTFDRAYLAELYSDIPNLPASARLAELEKVTGYQVFLQ